LERLIVACRASKAAAGDPAMPSAFAAAQQSSEAAHLNAGKEIPNAFVLAFLRSVFAALDDAALCAGAAGENAQQPRAVNLDATAFGVSRCVRLCVGAGAKETSAAEGSRHTGEGWHETLSHRGR